MPVQGDTQCVDAPTSSACLRNRPQNKRQQHPNHRHSGISAARRAGLPTGVAASAVAKRLHGRDIVAALLGLFWRLLREGRLKVARGRSWQPEIGMEHASRGRRSGNKGVGARWRGRFRIFSARHCSRTKVSHAENSGMTMLFARRRIPPALRLRCREATAREGHCGGAVGFVLEVVAGGEVESCEGEVVAARDWHGACLPGSAFWK